MEIEKLKTFITVARFGSFSQAADELYLTASAVSKHIASLEHEFGRSLFVREPKKVTLTPWGKECLAHAEKIVKEYAGLKASLGSGEVKLVCIPFQSHLLPDIRRFSVLWPSTVVNITERHGPEIVKAVKNGEFELGFAGTPYSYSDKLERYVLYEHRVGAVLPLDHPLAGKGPVSIHQLEKENFYLMGPETGMYPFYLNIFRENEISPNIVGTSTREDNLITSAAEGGATLLSYPEVEPYNNDHATFVELEEDYRVGIAMLKRNDRSLSVPAQHFWDYIISL